MSAEVVSPARSSPEIGRSAAWVVAVGPAAFLASFLAEVIAARDLTPENVLPTGPIWITLITALVVAPLLETGIVFVGLGALFWRFRAKLKNPGLYYAILTASAGASLHGGGLEGLGRGIGFLFLGFLFWRTRERFGLAAAFWATLAAHIVWNALAVITVYARG